jgi:predicted metal-dependent enzyme (double-stranded beta helix superfamily)
MSATTIESTTPETAPATMSGPTGADAADTRPSLAEIARSLADRPAEWVHRVRLSADGRWYERLHHDDEHEIWLISWLPGQATGFHDHGESRGAFAVALGTLEEHSPRVREESAGRPDTEGAGLTRSAAPTGRTTLVRSSARTVRAGESSAFGTDHVHDVRNASDAPAVSVHVYSPPLSTMNRYELTEGGLVSLVTERAGDW